jgi:acyl-CoA thioester hydrolase
MRIKLDFPEKIHFTTTITVRISDINYGNHVGNDNIVSMIHEARVQFLQSLGYTELNIEGLGLIMSDLAVIYKKQLFYGDELTIEIAVTDLTPKSFNLYYKLSTKETSAAIAKTGMLCYDYSLQQIANIPASFSAHFA